MTKGPNDGRAAPAGEGVPAPGDVIASKYEVESVLGAGGMGVVVAARHQTLGQRVAIKFLRSYALFDDELVARFVREARAAVSITSEHVARVIDVGTMETGSPFIVMEYLAGSDLAQMLRARGRFEPAEAAQLVLQACEAIAEAHSLGIVHRDLKPANLFVTHRADGSPLVKVLDFGISKAPEEAAAQGEEGKQREAGDTGLTGTGLALGSPRYMSPEQIRNARATDARTDVWSIGVILYELLTGASPFAGETMGDTLAKIVSEPPAPLREARSDLPDALVALVSRCLERDLALRAQSIAEIAKALLPFVGPTEAVLVERILRVSAGATAAPSARVPCRFAREHALANDSGRVPAAIDAGRVSEGSAAGSAAVSRAGVPVPAAEPTVAAWHHRSGAPPAPHSGARAGVFAAFAVMCVLGVGGAAFLKARTVARTAAISPAPAGTSSSDGRSAPGAESAQSADRSALVPSPAPPPPSATSIAGDAGAVAAARSAAPPRVSPPAPPARRHSPARPAAKPPSLEDPLEGRH